MIFMPYFYYLSSFHRLKLLNILEHLKDVVNLKVKS